MHLLALTLILLLLLLGFPKFHRNPDPAHWEAVRNILGYLKGTSTHWLVFGERVG